MSAETGSQSRGDRLAALEERLEALEAENRRKDERIAELEERLASSGGAVIIAPDDDLENLSIEAEGGGRIRLGSVVKGNMEELWDLDARLEALEEGEFESVKQLQQELKELRDESSYADARLRRKLNHIAEETDVDISDQAVSGDDKITQLLKNGPETVWRSPQEQSTLERARFILSHASDLGSMTRDEFGKRFVFKTSDVRGELERARDESLQANQIHKAFDRLEELAKDSTRRVDHGQDPEGNHKLAVYLEQEDL